MRGIIISLSQRAQTRDTKSTEEPVHDYKFTLQYYFGKIHDSAGMLGGVCAFAIGGQG